MDSRADVWVKRYTEIWKAGYKELADAVPDPGLRATTCNGMLICADYKHLLEPEAAPAKPMRDPMNGLDTINPKEPAPAANAFLEEASKHAPADPVSAELTAAAAYDPAAKKWIVCPTCGTADIDHTTGARPWQGCYTDKIFLQGDGTLKPFKRDAGQKRVD